MNSVLLPARSLWFMYRAFRSFRLQPPPAPLPPLFVPFSFQRGQVSAICPRPDLSGPGLRRRSPGFASG